MSSAATTDGFKLLGEHREGCWGHEAGGFLCYDGEERRDRIGRKGGYKSWHRFRCNDPDCESVALVRNDVVAHFVNEGVSRV